MYFCKSIIIKGMGLLPRSGCLHVQDTLYFHCFCFSAPWSAIC